MGDLVAGGHDLRRQARALGAQHEQRRARRASAPAARVPAPGTSATARSLAARASSQVGADHGLAEDRAHAGPHRLRAERIRRLRAQHDLLRRRTPAPRAGSCRRCRGPRRRAGRADGASRLGPALHARRRAPASRCRALPARGQRLALDRQPAPRRAGSAGSASSAAGSEEHASRARGRDSAPRSSMSSPSAMNRPVRSRCLRSCSLRSSFRRGLLCACDGFCHVGSEHKKGGRPAGRRPGGLPSSALDQDPAADTSRACLARSANRRKVSGSRTATSASILRLTSTSATRSPAIMRL